MSAQPFEVKWGILATGGIATGNSLSQIYLSSPSHLFFLRQANLFRSSSIRKRHPHQPSNALSNRHQTHPPRRSFLLLCHPRRPVPPRCQGSLLRQIIRYLSRTRRRARNRHHLRRDPTLSPLSKRHARLERRQTRSLREGIHRQRRTSEGSLRYREVKGIIPHGGRLDAIFPLEH